MPGSPFPPLQIRGARWGKHFLEVWKGVLKLKFDEKITLRKAILGTPVGLRGWCSSLICREWIFRAKATSPLGANRV